MSVTIKDVAKLAGTSTATVSKVMNGSYSISRETVERVHRAMEELNYHPSNAARNLAKRVTKAVIFLTSLGRDSGFSNPHMFEIMAGLESVLSEKGYAMTVRSIAPEDVCAYVQNAMETKMADGFVIHAAVISPELDELIYRMEIPHIIIGMPGFTSHFCWIDINNKLAGEMAAAHLLKQGYQKLSFIGGEEGDLISEHRQQGVMDVLKEHDLIMSRRFLKHGESACDSAYSTTNELLRGGNELPDAIICANNYIAYGCVMALKDAGIRIPEQMGIITFDDYPFSQVLRPMLTVVSVDVYDVGIQAGRYILQKIRKPNLFIQTYITLPLLIERDSTRK
ncbi:MAG: LacI family transcriptional regulator [Lachnospiraceae bacterium]|nr:LacI family transcriptional regulator [Lachnospiraceae bacterium]